MVPFPVVVRHELVEHSDQAPFPEESQAIDQVLGGVHSRPPASMGSDAGGQARDFLGEESMVEGKGFEPSTSALRTPRSPN
jgi:hypothetical protein